MAAPPSIRTLTADGLAGDQRKIVETVAQPLNGFMSATQAALSKGLTLNDNLDVQIHKVKQKVTSPWSPLDFTLKTKGGALLLFGVARGADGVSHSLSPVWRVAEKDNFRLVKVLDVPSLAAGDYDLTFVVFGG